MPFNRTSEFADDGRVRAPQNPHDFAFGAAVGIGAAHTDHDAVAVHRLPRLLGRDEDVAAHAFERVVGRDEAVAIAVHVQAAGGELAAAAGDGVLPGAQLDQIAARGQPRQRQFQVGASRSAYAQFAHELFEIGARMRQAGDVFENFGVVHSCHDTHAFT